MGRLARVDVRGDRQDRISGSVGWQKTSYAITGSGSHTLKWRCVKDESGSGGTA